jgi:hypothetical protein
VSLTTIAILVGLAVLTVWGVIAPRAQWRVLAGWSRRNSYANEPGPVSVGIHRTVSIVATVVLAFASVALYNQYRTEVPEAPPSPSALEKMWGNPAPVIVDRVIAPQTSSPTGLVRQPILSYQPMDGARRIPAYLFDLRDWAPKIAATDSGIVGVAPSPGLTGLDSASLVLHVRGDRNCVPRSVVAVESATTVAVAVFYGRPNPQVGDTSFALADCTPAAVGEGAVSVLVPVVLANLVDKRAVVNLDGSAIPATPDLIDDSGL